MSLQCDIGLVLEIPQTDLDLFMYFIKAKREGLQIRYGSLPREAVCTENLTPWIKLLPCQAKVIQCICKTIFVTRDSNLH